MEKKRFNKKQIIFGILGIALFIAVGGFCQAPAVLDAAAAAAGHTGRGAMLVLGSLLFAICWWIGAVAADWVTALLMVVSWTLFNACSIPEAFTAFAGSTVWLVIGAFTIASAINKTGLLRRIALNFMKIFSPKFNSQVMALMLAGTICSPLIPSTSAKGVLGASMANNLAEVMGYASQTKARTGLFVASWLGFSGSAAAFLSGSAFNYVAKGYMPEDVQGYATWTNWLVAMLPWLVIFLVGMYFAVLFLYRPKGETEAVERSVIDEQRKALGKMGRDELITGVVLVICLIFWILEKVVGINATTTALLGAAMLFVLGVLEPKDIQTRVAWGMIIFVGCVLCLGSRFTDMGISVWIGSVLSPFIGNISSVYLLILLLFVFILAIRFFIASQAVVVGLTMTIMMPILQTLGVSPLVTGIMIAMGCNVWFVLFQNSTYLASYGAMEGTVVHRDAAKSCWVYALLIIAASFISIPYWSMLGYIG